MKKVLFLVITLLLLLSFLMLPASAAGKLSVVQEKFYVFPYSSYHSGHVFAELKNIGDKPVEFNGGLLELFDAEGNSIESENYIRCRPKILDAGETGFLYVSKSVKEATDKSFIDDYLLTVTGKGTKEVMVKRLETSNANHRIDENSYRRRDYLVVDVTNNTEDTQYDFYVVYALRNENGELLYVDSVNPSYVGIKSGGTVEIEVRLDSDIVDHFLANNITISSIETIAYVELD